MLNSLANKKTTRNTKNSTIENTKQLSIAHQLAHSIRNEDSDHFFSIYDTIPLDWEESTIAHIKETARRLSELPLIEFESDCIISDCKSTEMSAERPANEKYQTPTTQSQNDGDITRNESFFADKSKLTNPVYNPLLLASTNKFYNVNNPSKITISNQALYAENFENHTSGSNSLTNKSFLLSGTGLADTAKCRFVTNQLYQQSKDSKHNECVLTSCFDEVMPANQTDEDEDDNENDSENSSDSDENDYESDQIVKKESMSTSSSTGSSSSSTNNMNHPITEQQSVIIDMEEEEEEDCQQQQDFKINNNSNSKEKFESMIQSVEEKKKQKKENPSDIDMLDLLNAEAPLITRENKYEKDAQLLNLYKEECKYGYSTDGRTMLTDTAKKILNTLRQTDNSSNTSSQNCSTGVAMTTNKPSNLNNEKRFSLSNNVSQMQRHPLMASNMKNDFSKNEDEDYDSNEEESTAGISAEYLHDNSHNNNNSSSLINSSKTSIIQTKILLNNHKPPPPPSTSLYSSNIQKPDDSDDLLNILLSNLKNKPVANLPKSQSPLQFNNYKTEVDNVSNFGLNYSSATNAVKPITSSLLNTSDVTLEDLDKKTSSSSCSSSSSSSSGGFSKPGAINRRSAEAYMDSHGSSLTNSSKQEEDDDLDEDVSANNTSRNQNPTMIKHDYDQELSDHETNDYILKNKSKISNSASSFLHKYSSNYGTIKNKNHLKQTIDELSLDHVEKNTKQYHPLPAQVNADYSSSGSSVLNSKNSFKSTVVTNKQAMTSSAATTTTPTSTAAAATTSQKSNSKLSSSNGVFHQRYSDYQYNLNDGIDSTKTSSLYHLDNNNNNVNESSPLLSSSISTSAATAVPAPTPIVTSSNNTKFNNFILNSKVPNSNNNNNNSTTNTAGKRNNRKSKLKASLELNPDGEGPNGESSANKKYSEHFSEDIDTLLQFITSSDTSSTSAVASAAATAVAALSNPKSSKTVKQSQPQSQAQSAKKQPPPPQQQQQSSKLTEKNNTNKPNKSAKPNAFQATMATVTTASTSTNKSNEINTQQLSDTLNASDNQDKKLKEEKAGDEQAVKKPNELDVFNELNGFISANSNPNTSGEFVTVKGRKKTNKKEISQQQYQLQQPKQLSNTIRLNKPKLPEFSKPNSSETNKKTVQPQTIKQPFIASKPVKEVLPLKSSISAPIPFATVAAASSLVSKVNTAVESNSLSTPPQTSVPTTSSTTSSANDFLNEMNNAIFPPLLPTNNGKLLSAIVAESKPVTVERFEPVKVADQPEATKSSNTQPICVQLAPATATLAVSIVPVVELEQQLTTAAPANIKPAKKNKLEFLNMPSNNSVIFLDEIMKVKSNSKNDSNSLNSEATSNTIVIGNQSKNEKNILNGIKFGFIDSSSSDDEINVATVSMPALVAQLPETVKEESVDKPKTEEVKPKKKLVSKFKQHQSKSSTSSTTSSAFSSHLTMATATSSTSSTDNEDDYDSENLNPTTTTTTTSNTNSATGTGYQRKQKKKNKKNLQKLKPSISFNNKQANRSSDESLSNDEKSVMQRTEHKHKNSKPVNSDTMNGNQSYASATTTTTTTLTTSISAANSATAALTLLNMQSHPNSYHNPTLPIQPQQLQSQQPPLPAPQYFYYPNQMNAAYLTALYAGYSPQGLLPPNGSAQFMVPPFVQQQQQQFYQSANFYYNQQQQQQQQHQQQQSQNEAKSAKDQTDSSAQSKPNHSSTNSSNNSTPTPSQMTQNGPSSATQLNQELNFVPPIPPTGYSAPTYLTPFGYPGYSYMGPVDYLPVAVPGSSGPLTSPPGGLPSSETLIQVPIIPPQMVQLPQAAASTLNMNAHLNSSSIVSPIQQATQNGVETSSSKKEDITKNSSNKSRYNNQSNYRNYNGNHRNNFNYNHSQYNYFNQNNANSNYYHNPHHSINQNTDYYPNRMPVYYPAVGNQLIGANPTIIADALQVAYTADYKGDFNLDEAAYYIAKQWNNMKLSESTNTNNPTISKYTNDNSTNSKYVNDNM